MENNRMPLLPSYQLSIPEFESIPAENWVAGEKPVREVLYKVWPTYESEDKRKAVVQYLERLIERKDVMIKVFAYGSFPLKAYLPDGDIDLTVLGPIDFNLSEWVVFVLEREQINNSAKFRIEDINFINAAEVKLVKCIVGGISIDFSFNQLSGLCSLCLIERVDSLIEKDHIFKRSIILIKAWCFYESRVLGSSHRLISTYALEMLVLHTFCMYNDSLTDPLMVMYRFLEYYSKFDWENYCVSIDGPVEISSLPNVTVENPVNPFLLGGTPLREYLNMFRVPDFINSDTDMPGFTLKPMNIIDPLKESNNLGKSVSRGNFHRIRSAFRTGAHMLGKIMLLPSENVGDGIKKFYEEIINSSQLLSPETSVSSSYLVNEVATHDEDSSNGSNGHPAVSIPETNGVSTLASLEGTAMDLDLDLDLDDLDLDYDPENEEVPEEDLQDILDELPILQDEDNETNLDLINLDGEYKVQEP